MSYIRSQEGVSFYRYNPANVNHRYTWEEMLYSWSVYISAQYALFTHLTFGNDIYQLVLVKIKIDD